jgi:hypothetical protein
VPAGYNLDFFKDAPDRYIIEEMGAKAKKTAEPTEAEKAAVLDSAKDAHKGEKPAEAPHTEAEVALAEAKPEEAPAEPAQCEAITGSGSRCKNNAAEGSKFCGTHKSKE